MLIGDVNLVYYRLYQSPKASPASDDNKYSSPVDWLKDEFENPHTPQLASAKRNILYKMGVPITDCKWHA